MIEVFKTNVQHSREAEILLKQIHGRFENCEENFDLEDCDRILRIKSTNGPIPVNDLIGLLRDTGYGAELLSDEVVG